MALTLSQPVVRTSPQRSLELAAAAAREAEDNRGQNVVVLDMREQTTIFDYFVIATGTSNRQLRAMSDAIDDSLDQRRLVMFLLGAFAMLAMVLAALGISGVVSYSVGRSV